MTESLYSPSWYRVSGLRPRLRSHVEIHRHTYRGELWYVLQDHASGQFLRFTSAAYLIIGMMNGDRTVEEILSIGKDRLGQNAPTQQEMIHLLSQLHAADALQMDVPPDVEELSRRHEKKVQRKWQQKLRNPLAMSFSILDPERFLVSLEPVARLIFSWPMAILWMVVVCAGIVLAGLHWADLSQNVTDQVLAPDNLIIMWCLFPILKAFHELGHALAVKKLGGEVHDVGIMLLVLTPIPYIDASSSLAFRNKWERILVGGAGLLTEIFIAALAVIVWTNIEPGALRGLLFNIIFIAGISSLLFNGNPLLRYDAYYMLADLLEIPNLGTRSLSYLGYLAQRYLFSMDNVEPPISTRGERIWFVTYGVLSFLYRIIIYIAIIQFIAGRFFVFGVILALWAIASMIVLPVFKAGRFLFLSPKLGRKRKRAIAISVSILAVVLVIITLVPFPLSTVTEGVIWLPDEAIVRAQTEGFVDEVKAVSGHRVKVGDEIIKCSDPLLSLRERVLEAQLQGFQIEFDMKERNDRIEALIKADDIKQVKKQLEDVRSRLGHLVIKSQADGVLLIPGSQDLPGRFVKRGEIVGYVLERFTPTARATVAQPDVDLVRQRTQEVQVRLPVNLLETVPAKLIREVPAATENLPAAALGSIGGGKIAIDPRDNKGMKSMQKLFLFDVELPPSVSVSNVGGRVYVRFDHGWEPLVGRWYRAVRNLLLRSFSV